MQPDIDNYHAALSAQDRHICLCLAAQINKQLASATAKVWHGHPVWFMDDNPIVGYSKQKQGIQLLFWSGQSFDEPSLRPEGKFKAASLYLHNTTDLSSDFLDGLLQKAVDIQWDYKNLVKRKGILERLT
ncbi:MAG: hypothetical protein RIR90_1500 [Bacteroidota bacterium]|jgi:hypothetical protein